MMKDIGVSGCKANVFFYRTLRERLFEQAIAARSEELKWEHRYNALIDLPKTLSEGANTVAEN